MHNSLKVSVLAISAVSVSMMLLTGCGNTFRGASQDIQALTSPSQPQPQPVKKQVYHSQKTVKTTSHSGKTTKTEVIQQKTSVDTVPPATNMSGMPMNGTSSTTTTTTTTPAQ